MSEILCGNRQPVLDRVHQRPPTRLDDVRARADGAPALMLILRVDQHARDGFGAVVAVEDADFVIGQMERVNLRDSA